MKYRNGILGTLLFHILLVLMFVFLKFSTPLPLPEEEGILVNFGYDDAGFGKYEPESIQEDFAANVEEAAQQEDEEEILTQDFEESVSVKSEKETKDPTPTNNNNETEYEVKEEKPEKETRVIDARSLFQNRNKSNKEGVTEGDGNQGSKTGAPNADNHSPGSSSGSGGVSYSLAGRNPLVLPKPEYNYQVEGIVVVEVKVDKNGNVTYANAGVRGSTTLDQYLLKVAKEAALRAKFDRKPDAPAYQKGTITYHFILQ